MNQLKRTVSIAMAAIMAVSMFSFSVSAEPLENSQPIVAAQVAGATDKTPTQLNVHMGDDPSTQVNVTYTTQADCNTVITLNKLGDSKQFAVVGTQEFGQANKCFHKIAVNGLEPNTTYEYVVGEGTDTYAGKFKTAPAKGSNDSFKFAYLADTQVSNETNAKALGATLAEVNKIQGLDFVYLAGDVTDSATNESQWEWLFNNEGAFPTGGEDMFANNLVTVVQGNHDNNVMNRHINAPAQAGNIVYSFDYGPAKFIMLNLEEAKNNADARARQEAMVREAVADAKANGQWTIVGFHKSIYTGASHIVDSDIIAARQYWAPIFSELDVDMVLQGHDHVYSRGFVTAEGTNANPVINAQDEVQKPTNAPLYMVGGHAGGLKWYSKKNYTVKPGDPLATNYSFLDVNSTDTNSDVKKEQVIVEIEVSKDTFTLNTYMFKYDTNTNSITTEKYLYDTMTCTKDVPSVDLTGSDLGVVEKGDMVSYTVSMNNIKDTNAFDTAVNYDSSKLELVSAESNIADTSFVDTKDENGKAEIIIGTQTLVTSKGSTDVATFTFKLKKDAEIGNTTVTLAKANSAQAVVEDGQITGAFDVTPNVGKGSVTTEIYSYKAASDINMDGRITLADLSMVLVNYQSTERKYDIDLSGIVDTKDCILVSGYIRA